MTYRFPILFNSDFNISYPSDPPASLTVSILIVCQKFPYSKFDLIFGSYSNFVSNLSQTLGSKALELQL